MRNIIELEAYKLYNERNVPPQGTQEYNEWHAKSVWAIGLILNSISTKVAQVIPKGKKTLSSVWAALQESFVGGDTSTLLDSICKLKELAPTGNPPSQDAFNDFRNEFSVLKHSIISRGATIETFFSSFLLDSLAGNAFDSTKELLLALGRAFHDNDSRSVSAASIVPTTNAIFEYARHKITASAETGKLAYQASVKKGGGKAPYSGTPTNPCPGCG